MARYLITTVVMFMATQIAFSTHASAQDEPAREPGLSVRLFDIGEEMDRLLPLVAGQTPNVSKVVPELDLRSNEGGFDPLRDYFISEVDGYLNIETAGEYALRLVSDDGSKLWINNELVIDHDGLHGPNPKQATVQLDAGEHVIFIRHFENRGHARLSLLWRPPGEDEFEVIPESALTCQADEVRVTSPGEKRVVRPRNRNTPGDGRPLEDVHPSFDLAQARPESFTPLVGGIDFLSDGRLAVCTWDPDGAVYILDNVDGDDPQQITVKRFAAGLAEPLGLTAVDDEIFVLQKQELTQLIDHDGDGVADEYRAICSGWPVTANFHEFAFGLAHDDGHFYGNLAIAIDPGGKSTQPQIEQRGTVIRMSRDGSYEVVADGLRTPNGIGFGVDDEIFVSDNQGDWLPSSKILHLQEGAFYGSYAVEPERAGEREEMPPVVWLPQGEIGNSPGNIVPIDLGPYENQMLHTDVTHGGIKRVFAEKIDGAYQGAVFRFTQGLEAGVNRVKWGPDGALYVGGIGSTGNWGQQGKERYGLQRLTYNGEATFEMRAVRAMSNGLEIEFTTPLGEGFGEDAGGYLIKQWRYEPTDQYGGPKIDETELPVEFAHVSSDRRRVYLDVDGIQEGHVVYVRLVGPFEDEAGRKPWSTEAWYTMNAIPDDRPGPAGDEGTASHAQNTLTDEQKAEGWELLFDGNDPARHWRGFRQEDLPDGWQAVDGALTRVSSGGDIVTREEYRNFELQLEWKVEPGGNSGVFWRVSEDESAVWLTGPEMQILDDERHPDGQSPKTSAGSDYALYAPKQYAARPAGRFNRARIRVNGDQVTYWLNGARIVEYELHSEEWEQRVAQSKFADFEHYGRMERGHIALQDHGDRVSFRNIMIRPLPDDG